MASNRAKTDFLAKISHDIRTPLNAILGAADLLSQTSLSFDQSEYVHMFQRNCRRLLALINDFLDFSRIEAGAIRIEKAPFQIREVVDDAAATFRDSAARKGILLRVDIDPQAPEWQIGDSLRIQQVLVNLLSNALKFTASGRIDVRVKVLEAANSGRPAIAQRLRCEVVDTGPGIAAEHLDKIFVKFVQLPNQTAGHRGAGLGLAICHELVELMGGEMGVFSQVGGGSNFHFNLPLEAAILGSAVRSRSGCRCAGRRHASRNKRSYPNTDRRGHRRQPAVDRALSAFRTGGTPLRLHRPGGLGRSVPGRKIRSDSHGHRYAGAGWHCGHQGHTGLGSVAWRLARRLWPSPPTP